MRREIVDMLQPRLAVAGAVVAFMLLLAGCLESAEPGEDTGIFRPPPRTDGSSTATPTAIPGAAQQARYYLNIGRQEFQTGAYFSAIAALEMALQIDPTNTEAADLLGQAREAARNVQPPPALIISPGGTVPTGSSGGASGPSVVVPVGTSIPTPASGFFPVETPRGCAGDERIQFAPTTAAVGDVMTVLALSSRDHQDVRLVGPGISGTPRLSRTSEGVIWSADVTIAQNGVLRYFFYVDVNTLCAVGSVTTTGRWELLGQGLPQGDEFKVTSVAVSPNFPRDTTIFVGTDGGGLFKSTNAMDTSPTFTKISSSFTIQRVSHIAISPDYARDGTIIASMYGFPPLFKSIDGGERWTSSTPYNPSGSPASSVHFSPNYATDATVFLSFEGGGVSVSQDRGSNWVSMNTGLIDQTVQALAVSANYGNDKLVFAGARFSGVFKLIPAGASPTPAATAVPVGAGTETPTPTATPLATATPVLTAGWQTHAEGLTDLWIGAMAISPYYSNDRTVFAGGRYGGLFKQAPDGKWQQKNGGLSDKWAWIRSIVLSPRYASDPTVYVGTRAGVYRSLDGGETWSLMSTGIDVRADLPNPERGVSALALSPDYANDGVIFAGVWQGGLYRARDQ